MKGLSNVLLFRIFVSQRTGLFLPVVWRSRPRELGTCPQETNWYTSMKDGN
jgi:hypothetical protein